MKKLIPYLALFMLSCKATKVTVEHRDATAPTNVRWTTAGEKDVVTYQVQQSPDSLNWIVVTTVKPSGDSAGAYSYAVPLVKKYYRVKANMKVGVYYTESLAVIVRDSLVIVTNMKIKRSWLSDVISWDTKNEWQVKYYLIEKGSNGAFILVNKAAPQGDSKYTQSIFTGAKTYNYRNTPFYKNGKKGAILNF